MHCRICNKPLSNFNSIKLGIGPICRAEDSKQGDLFMDGHADYTVIDIKKNYILIKDNDGRNCKSVTNDAEWVVSELHKQFDVSSKRIFYVDTERRIDELAHENGVFKGFRPGPAEINHHYSHLKQENEKQAREERRPGRRR